MTPSFFPIQCCCATFTFSDQSRPDRFPSSFSAYAVILKNHCSSNLFSTIFPHRSQTSTPAVGVRHWGALRPDPLITCSSAKTVLQLGHQFTSALPR